MSTYYEFYVGLLKDDKIEAIGPYFRQDGVYHLRPILERSRSFISWNEFDSLPLPVEKMTDDQTPYFSTEGWDDSGEHHSITEYIPYDKVRDMADDGLVQGYVTLEELDAVAESDYHPDALWDLWVRTPQMVAEMDSETRKQYGHIAYVDHCRTGYLCRQLLNAVDPFECGVSSKDLCFIVRIC